MILLRVAEFSIGFVGCGFVHLTDSYEIEYAHYGNRGVKSCQRDETFGAQREASEAQDCKKENSNLLRSLSVSVKVLSQSDLVDFVSVPADHFKNT